jgi:hypothetical protein
MKKRIRLLKISAGMTVALLAAGAVLVSVGVFDDYLDWDIFSPRVQKCLQGVFAACVALGFFGAAITVVLGVEESVRSLRNLARVRGVAEPPVEEPSRRGYVAVVVALLCAFALLIASLAFINHRVQVGRSAVFKKLAVEQFDHLSPRFSGALAELQAPPRTNVPPVIYDLVHSLDNHSFIERTTLYVSDPADAAAMWGYTAWRDYRTEDGFARFFVAQDFEKALQRACGGDPSALDAMNAARTEFSWYGVVTGAAGRPLGVVRIDANRKENFRNYTLF